MKIVTVDQMISLEQASERQGVSTDTLMENAGRVVAQAARDLMGGAAGKRVLVLVGPGNNGADGLVAARHLGRWGADVTAYVVASRPDLDPKMDLARQYGVAVLGAIEDPGLRKLDRLIARCQLVIDAILGTGSSRPLAGAVKDVVSRLGTMRSGPNRPALLALDLPTGLNADTGEVDPSCPSADLTVALGFPKVGLLTFPGAERVGRLEVADIGLPPGLENEKGIDLELLTSKWVQEQLPSRPLNSHKGTFGHALIVAGSRHYVGAAYLAAQAAVRVGAGLTTLASPQSVYSIAAGKLTEVIHLPLPEDGEGRFHPDGSRVVRKNLSRYSAMLVGCGMGWSAGTASFLERLLLDEPRPSMPTVVDADGRLIGIVGCSDIMASFVRPDELIQDEIQVDILDRIIWTEPGAVTVEVIEGQVRLSGSVPKKIDARILWVLTRRLDGVVDVNVDEVRYPYDDTKAAQAAGGPIGLW